MKQSNENDWPDIFKSSVHAQALQFVEMQNPENSQKAIKYLAFLALDGKIPNKFSKDEKIIVNKFNTQAHELGIISEKFISSDGVREALCDFFTMDDNERISKIGRDILITIFNNVKRTLSEINKKSEVELSKENTESEKIEYVRKFTTRDKKHIANWQKKEKVAHESNNEPAKLLEDSIQKATPELSKRDKNFKNWGRL